MSGSVAGGCDECGHIIELPGSILSATWNCPSCGEHNADHPIGSAEYQREVDW